MKQKSSLILFLLLILANCYAHAQPKTSVKRGMTVTDPIKLPVNLIKSGFVTVHGTILQPDAGKKTIQFIVDNAITNEQGIYVAEINKTGKFIKFCFTPLRTNHKIRKQMNLNQYFYNSCYLLLLMCSEILMAYSPTGQTSLKNYYMQRVV